MSKAFASPSFFAGLSLKRKFAENPGEACLSLTEAYGDTVKFNLGKAAFSLINDRDLIAHILDANKSRYLPIADFAPITGFLQDGLFTPDENKAESLYEETLRKTANVESLPPFFSIIEEEVAQLREHYFAGKNNHDKVNIELEMQRLLIKVIARGFLAPGLEINADSLQESTTDITGFNNFTNLIKIREKSGTLPGKTRIEDMLPKYVQESFTYLEEMADHIGADFMGNNAERSSYMEVLHGYLKKHNTEYHKVTDIIKAVFFSTALPMAEAATWVLYYLDTQPGLRKKLDVEIETAGDSFQIDKFPFLMSVLLETLRIQPPVRTIHRFANYADSIGEFWIKENSWLLISPFAMHRNKQYWNTTDFTPGTVDYRDMVSGKLDYCYMPFGYLKASSEQTQFQVQILVKLVSVLLKNLRALFYDKKYPKTKDAAILAAKERLLVKIERKGKY